MGDLTENFSRWEFACRCRCGFDTVDFLLLEELQKLRTELGKRIDVVSGARCWNHNLNQGGAQFSRHLRGQGADIKVEGMRNAELFEFLLKRFPRKYGKGLYKGARSSVHLDIRAVGVSWEA